MINNLDEDVIFDIIAKFVNEKFGGTVIVIRVNHYLSIKYGCYRLIILSIYIDKYESFISYNSKRYPLDLSNPRFFDSLEDMIYNHPIVHKCYHNQPFRKLFKEWRQNDV